MKFYKIKTVVWFEVFPVATLCRFKIRIYVWFKAQVNFSKALKAFRCETANWDDGKVWDKTSFCGSLDEAVSKISYMFTNDPGVVKRLRPVILKRYDQAGNEKIKTKPLTFGGTLWKKF